jgi:hypothetical protein
MHIGNRKQWIYFDESKLRSLIEQDFIMFTPQDLPKDLSSHIITSGKNGSFSPRYIYEFMSYLSSMADKKEAMRLAEQAGFIYTKTTR